MSFTAYGQGRDDALAVFKVAKAPAGALTAKLAQDGAVEPEKKKSWWPALAAGALGGLGAYKFLRTPAYASNPALRAIQQKANREGFHRAVRLAGPGETDHSPTEAPGLLRRAYEATLPKLDSEGNLDRINKLKFRFHEGSAGIPTAYDPKQQQAYVVGPERTRKVEGLVYGRENFGVLPGSKAISGGQDLEGSRASQEALTQLSRAGKAREADLLTRYAPDALPRSYTRVSRHVPAGAPTVEKVRQLQANMSKAMADQGISHFAMKPSRGFVSAGQFPISNQDWGAHYEKYLAHMSDPTNRAAFKKVTAGTNAQVNYLRERGLLPGHVLSDMFKNRSSAMAQEWLPGAMGEFRVHTMGGTAPVELITPRHAHNLASRSVDKKQLGGFVENALSRLPEEYRTGMYGLDVMPFKMSDGSMQYKIIEMNPHGSPRYLTRRDPNYHGSSSGLLRSKFAPGAAWRQYRAVTGRHDVPPALLAAMGVGGGAAAAARALAPDEQEQSA